MMIATAVALALTIPFVAIQVWLFVKPALKQGESCAYKGSKTETSLPPQNKSLLSDTT
jgi:Sec-independent protein secretion pathway component TatC